MPRRFRISQRAWLGGLALLVLLAGAPSVAATPEYFSVRPDLRRCIAPLCGGFFIDPLNQRSMRCGDGKRREACYVADIDLGALGPDVALSSSPLGLPAVVRGVLEDTKFDPPGVVLQTLVASELWEPAGGSDGGRVFVRLSDSGIRCVTEPCASIAVERLNRSKRRRLIEAVDLRAAELDERQQEEARERIASEEGLVASGSFRRRRDADGARLRVFVAAAVYFPVESPKLCTGDGDCPADRWCRPEADRVGRCVPFVGPGDSCGGFVLPSFFERCEPGLQCVPSEPTGDAPGTCATCEYQGVPYQEGESFPAADGCNACTCLEGGRVLCSLRPCTKQPPTCRVAGCSGQLCVDASLGPVLTTCEWRPEYACLQHSSCGSFGPGGTCAWEPTPDYRLCREQIDSTPR